MIKQLTEKQFDEQYLITYETEVPKVYQYPSTGRPDEGLEVYIWPNDPLDVYFDGRPCVHTQINDILFIVVPNQANVTRINLITKEIENG